MATTVSYENVKKGVVALLQASQTAYGASTTGDAPDGSNRQYSSSTEINDRILEVDAEVCMAICCAMQHPFQSTFATVSSALPGPRTNLPPRNGIILSIQCQSGFDSSFINTNVNTTANTILIANHGLVTGQKVWVSNGGTLPSPLTASTDYYVIRVDANTIQLAVSSWNAYAPTAIDLSTQGTGTTTIASQYVEGTEADSKDSVVEAFQVATAFTMSASGACTFWFIEGDEVYTSSPNCKVTYTDYTKGAAPQAPEPYEFALIAGTIGKILKDGGDDELATFYVQQYQQYMGSIMQGAMVLPAISAYKMQQAQGQ